jgi:hypothetical protein
MFTQIITNNNVNAGQRVDFATNLQPLAVNAWSPGFQIVQNSAIPTTVLSNINITGNAAPTGANVEIQVSLDGNFWVPLSTHYLANTNGDYAITTINQTWGSIRARYTANGANSTVSVSVRG